MREPKIPKECRTKGCKGQPIPWVYREGMYLVFDWGYCGECLKKNGKVKG